MLFFSFLFQRLCAVHSNQSFSACFFSSVQDIIFFYVVVVARLTNSFDRLWAVPEVYAADADINVYC